MTQFSIRAFTIRSSAIVLAIASVLLTNVHAQDDDYESSWQSIPAKAFAFVHVDVAAIAEAPSLTIPRDIVMGVQEELDQVFERNTGLRILDLMDVTVVIPSLEEAMAIPQAETVPGLFLMSFESPVNVQRIGKALDGQWSSVTVKGSQLFTNATKDKAIFRHSENTLVFGSRAHVQWFIDNRDDQDYSNLSDAMTESEYGQIIFGIDGTKIPKAITQHLPPEFRFVEKMSFAAVSFDLIGGMTMDSVVEFESVKDAKEVSKVANKQLENLRAFITGCENEAMQNLMRNQSNFDGAIESLTELALYRYGKKLANETEVQQFRNRLLAHVGIEGIDGTLVLTGVVPAMIGSAGQQANSKFGEVAARLDAK